MSGPLRPDKAPAQQLMTMLWAEGQEDKWHGKIFASTSRLLQLGYVTRCSDGLSVQLTEAGRNAAKNLMTTTEGQRYMAEAEA